MDLLTYNAVKKAWQQIAQHTPESSLPPTFELEIYKKLLERFNSGPYYYYIFNTATVEVEFVSDGITPILGYSPQHFSVELVMSNIHPEDKSHFIMYEQEVTTFFSKLAPEDVLKYKVSYDYRLRCADGSYKWILQQVSTIQSDENGAVIRVLGVHTDITHLKTEHKATGLSFIGLEGAPSYYHVMRPDGTRSGSLFSLREKEVLNLVLAGHSTAEIASLLFVSPHTISVHRKNILRKSNCRSFVELAPKALLEGWL